MTGWAYLAVAVLYLAGCVVNVVAAVRCRRTGSPALAAALLAAALPSGAFAGYLIWLGFENW